LGVIAFILAVVLHYLYNSWIWYVTVKWILIEKVDELVIGNK
jgi:hypothetical protein